MMKKHEATSLFHVGDRVVCTCDISGFHTDGLTGTVVDVASFDITVEFDINIHGHDGGGKGKSGHCLYVGENEIALITEDYDYNGNVLSLLF